MFQYYLRLGLRSLRRNPALTALMVLTLAVGVAASIATLTILHAMSSDPIPGKSARLFIPLLDNGPAEGYNPAEQRWVPPQISYRDARNLVAGMPAARRTVFYPIAAPIEPPQRELPVMESRGFAVTRDFFPMLDAPFQHGQAWSEADDKAGSDVVVLSHALAETLFGTANPVGRRIRMLNHEYQVIGVLRPWRMVPRFYRAVMTWDAFEKEEDFWVPFASAIRHETWTDGGTSCSTRREPGWQGLLDSECTWVQVVVETPTPAGRADLQAWLDNYAAEQRRLGRMKRNAPNRLFNVMEWLEHHHIVSNDSRLSVWLAFAFLLLCLVNTVGLLLAKFSNRAPEVGVRRALGASRRQIFRQYLTEAAVVGLAGGLAGLVLAFGALALIALQRKDLAMAVQMDWQMLLGTFVLSVIAALLAGLLPTWRACQVTPALQLKSQ